MNIANRKELILSTIHDDLMNTKLVDTLNDLGIQAITFDYVQA